MNNLSLFLYLIDISSTIKFLSVLSATCSIVAMLLTIPDELSYYNVNSVDESVLARLSRLRKLILVILTISIMLFTLIPSKKTMYAIVASEVSDKIIEDPSVKPILEKSLLVIDSKLDDILENKDTKQENNYE